MNKLFKTAFLCLLLSQPASAQSGEIMGSDSLETVGELLRGTWIAGAPDHLGGREAMIVQGNALGLGYVDAYGDVDMDYEGGYTLDRDCNGTRIDGIYIVTEREHDPCWQIINLDLSKLEFRDKARFVNTEFFIQSR